MFGGPNMATATQDLPFGLPCERIEGSMYVSPCSQGIPKAPASPPPATAATPASSTKVNSMRRYVIDEVLGSADVLCSFTAVGTIPDSHELRIENGKIRFVPTVTLCAIDDGPDWGPICRGMHKSTTTTSGLFRA